MNESLSADFSKPGFWFRFEMFLPVVDNEGELIDPEKFDTLTSQLTDLFGGITFDYPYGGSGGANGMWYSSLTQKIERDTNAFIMILAKPVPKAIKYFSQNIKKWEVEFGQEKVLVTVLKVQTL